MKAIAIDTETTGLDIWHGCKPFYVATANSNGETKAWEWAVNPKNRTPIIPQKDKEEIQHYLQLSPTYKPKAPALIFHNAKFDILALESIGIQFSQADWKRVEDTLIASHLIASGTSHRLKDLAIQYLDLPDFDEKRIKQAANKARLLAKKLGWRIADKGDPHFPGIKQRPNDGWGVMDMWVPKQIAQHQRYKPDHENYHWRTLLAEYGNLDAIRTLLLWERFQATIHNRKQWGLYTCRKNLLPITYKMEQRGVSLNTQTLEEEIENYQQQASTSETICYKLAGGKIDNLNSPKQLQGILYSHFALPLIKTSKKTGQPSTDRETLNELSLLAPPRSKEATFIKHLKNTRKFSKAVDYLESYRKVAIIPTPNNPQQRKRSTNKQTNASQQQTTHHYAIIHPRFNPTGTDTTRFSASDPNTQNVSKQEDFNLRKVFSPLPGREWWAIDYSNIELRIFAYCSGDKRLIEAFEEGQSVHLIIAEELWPEEAKRLGEKFKESKYYSRTKNGNFALIYGASEKKGDVTYGKPGAYQRIKRRFPKINSFMESKSKEAIDKGFVTTLGGYPLQVTESKPHVAVNYFVQGTAGWCMVKAMNRVDEYLQTKPNHHLILTIHDELVFDFPATTHNPYTKKEEQTNNLHTIAIISQLMEASGKDIDIPTPTSIKQIKTNWAEGKEVTNLPQLSTNH